MGITHFDEAFSKEFEVGHIRGRWTMLGEALDCTTIGVRRLQIPEGGWSTPAHEHGRSEEIFYVLAGSGISWHKGQTAEIRAGDGILYRPRSGPHTLYALQPLDVLAFGDRQYDESMRYPQLEMSLVGGRAVHSESGGVRGVPVQFVREAEHGPPELPDAPDPQPSSVVNLEGVEPLVVTRPRIERTRRNFGRALSSVTTGLQHVSVAPGKFSTAQHCHSIEDEIFVILDGDGVLLLDDEETPVGPGHVVGRPASTGVSHVFRAGPDGLTYLAYGTRDKGDVCYYPRSKKIAFRGVHVTARIEKVDYWDGED